MDFESLAEFNGQRRDDISEQRRRGMRSWLDITSEDPDESGKTREHSILRNESKDKGLPISAESVKNKKSHTVAMPSL